MKFTIFKNQTGFTLLEMMIAISLFTVVMVVATSMFLRSIDSQSRSITSKSMQESLNFALAIMANGVAGAKPTASDCGCPVENKFFCISGSSESLTFKNSSDECVTYSVVLDSTRGINILALDRAGSPDYLTPYNVNVSSLKFFIASVDDLNYSIANVTMGIKGESLSREDYPDSVFLQTTIAIGQ